MGFEGGVDENGVGCYCKGVRFFFIGVVILRG